MAPVAPGMAATATDAQQRAALSGPPHRITTLDSGVRVVTERLPVVRSVALGFLMNAGSAGEHDGEAGISHLLEHMLFRGTASYGSQEIDELFDGMGAEINAGTDKEATSLYTRVLDRHLERAFDVMADMVWRPRFGELEAEREVVLEEIAMYEDDPQDRVFDILGRAIFGEHPLGRAVIGTAEVIGAVDREQLAAFHASRYTPGSIVIAAAGSVDHDALVEMVRAAEPAGGEATPAERAQRGGQEASGVHPPGQLHGQRHRAVPRLHRRGRDRPGGRAALRPAGPRRDPRRHLLFAALPGGARAPGPCLLGLLLLEPLRPHGRSGPLRREPARRTSPRRSRCSPPSCGAAWRTPPASRS